MYFSLQLRKVPCLVLMFLGALAAHAQGPQPQASPSSTQIVFLGTGMPFADPDRFGPATAIVVHDTSYLVDFGPGVVRRANAPQSTGPSKPWNPGISRSPLSPIFTPTTLLVIPT